MSFEKITDFDERMVLSLPTQFKDPGVNPPLEKAKNVGEAAKIVGEEIQEWEDANFDVCLQIQLDTVTKTFALNLIGKKFNQTRPDFVSNAQYKNMIRARQVVHRSEGSRENFIDIINALGGSVGTVTFIKNQYPASMHIEYSGIGYLTPPQVLQFLKDGSHQISFDIVKVTALKPFGFNYDPGAFGFGVGALGGS